MLIIYIKYNLKHIYPHDYIVTKYNDMYVYD
jgi:hypothetical protein